jgi:UDP-3-O-[3-hydroxymyristoyl] glucosamine N-acyltransferase
MSRTVQEIAKLVQGTVIGDGNLEIQGITNIEAPAAGLITFVQDEKGLRRIESSEIACLLVPPTLKSSTKTLIQVPHPKLAWAKLLGAFFPPSTYSQKISKQAFIAKSAKIGSKVTIEAFAVIGENSEIGDEAVILSHAVVGSRVVIGPKTVLHPAVVIYENCKVGASCIIHAGSVIGADGFGYVTTAQKQEKVPQVGNVIIEDDVELGAGVTIDRATIGSTRISQGVKIDNLVQIGHNVLIGPHTVISAQTGISGSSKIGAHVTMGGKVGVGDHVEIGNWTMVGAGAGFPSGKKVGEKQIVFGEPARPYEEARRQIAAQLRSAETLDDVRDLRKRVAELEKIISALPKSNT